MIEWIEAVLGEKLSNQPYEDVLRDGVVLCNLINKLAPGSVKKIQTKGTNFQLMENIQRYAWLMPVLIQGIVSQEHRKSSLDQCTWHSCSIQPKDVKIRDSQSHNTSNACSNRDLCLTITVRLSQPKIFL